MHQLYSLLPSPALPSTGSSDVLRKMVYLANDPALTTFVILMQAQHIAVVVSNFRIVQGHFFLQCLNSKKFELIAH